MSASKKHSISVEEYLPAKKEKNGSKFSIVNYISILKWLPNYCRLDGISDFVAGITLGLTMIPQSIAYAALAGLTAQYGLYSCFLGGFVYLIFGTIKEVSIGPSSLMALLTLEYTRNMPVDFVVLLCFLSGCMELLMGVLNLGFIVDFISIPVTSGFTSATSVIIIIAQLQGLLGLKLKVHDALDSLYQIFQNIDKIRIPDLILGICSIVFLLTFRKLKDIDCSFTKDNKSKNAGGAAIKKVLWFLSIGRNALIILITSVLSFHLETTGSSPFILSGKVKSGLPKVSLPPFSSQVGNQTYTFIDMCSHYGAGIFVLPLISVLANVAIAKAFATGSTVNATQEMLTLGVCNIFGSFVSSMPSCGAFTRSAVSSASGIRTPMAGLYTGIMALLALSFLTPYFYYIPRATLAAVLISAVIFMIDWRIIKLLCKGCRRDAVAAIVTFLFCITCGVEIGLLLGASFNLIFFLRPLARPKVDVIQCKTELGNKYVMLKPDAGLSYSAVDAFCQKIIDTIRMCGDNETPIVINCENVRSIDYTAIKGIENMSKDLNVEKDRLWLLYVKPEVIESIEILSENKHFRFIHNEDEISHIFYNDMCLSDGEDGTKLKLLQEVIENERLTYSQNEKDRYSDKPVKPIADCDNNVDEVTSPLATQK